MKARIVIVGAGFAGLETARRLAGAEVEITLIDRHNYLLFRLLPYQVATAALSPADIAWPIRCLLRDQPNVRVVMGRVIGVDALARAVLLENGARHGYEMLVLATGARHNYFGNDAWANDAPGLKKIDDAPPPSAAGSSPPLRRQRPARTRPGGRGAPDLRRRRRRPDRGRDGGRHGRARPLHAQARVPPDRHRREPRRPRRGPAARPRGLSRELSEKALAALQRLGVEVRLGQAVTGCDREGIELGRERIPAATIVWAAGVAASPAGRWLGIPTDRTDAPSSSQT